MLVRRDRIPAEQPRRNTMKPSRKTLTAIALSFALSLSGAAAWSATATTVFTVSANIVGACTQISASPISFGNVTTPIPVVPPLAATVSITCNTGTNFSISLDSPSRSIGGSYYAMTNTTGGALKYTITIPTGGTLWGTGPGTGQVAGTGTGASQSFTGQAYILDGQTSIPAGAYADQITATITF
jgi:spore coat protein U-like protein